MALITRGLVITRGRIGSLPFCLLIMLPLLATSAPLSAAVPGENGKIAFSSIRGTSGFEIYTMNPDGSSVTRLTSNGMDDTAASWSPDGTKIAFNSTRDGASHEIYVMNADGSGQTRLTNNPATDAEPAWSPDGGKIVFTVQPKGGNLTSLELFVMNADGTGRKKLTDNSAYDAQAAWSPDGSKIAFTSQRSGKLEIHAMNADGSGVKKLTTMGPTSSLTGEPSWSPDGARIAYRGPNDDIWVMNADGTSPQKLSSGTDYSPAWSPDGTKIVYGSYVDTGQEIFVMNADGTSPTRLTNNPIEVGDLEPDWQPLVPAPEPTPEPLEFKDGGFETPNDQGAWVTYGKGQQGGEQLGAWMVTGTVDHVGTLWKHAAGKFSVDLNGGGTGSVFQDLKTTPGASYELSFAIAGHMGCDGTVKTMDVMWGGEVAKSVSFDTSGHSYSDMGWRTETATLVAEEASTRLEFITTSAGTCGPVVDEVALKGEGGSSETTPPKTVIFGAPDSRTSDRTPVFKFRSNERGSTFVCKLDSEPFKACTSPHQYPRQDFGAHTFKVKATDVFGNKDKTPATHKWRISAR